MTGKVLKGFLLVFTVLEGRQSILFEAWQHDRRSQYSTAVSFFACWWVFIRVCMWYVRTILQVDGGLSLMFTIFAFGPVCLQEVCGKPINETF